MRGAFFVIIHADKQLLVICDACRPSHPGIRSEARAEATFFDCRASGQDEQV